MDELKKYFADQKDVGFAVLFGSVSKGKASPLSDIDIAVYFEGEKAPLDLANRQLDVTCDLMKLLKKNRIDIVLLNTANPFLAFQVVKYGKLIYSTDESFFYRFKAQVFGMYQDIRPMYDFYDKKTNEEFRRELYG
ncbi:MAG: nucleotidyltransferase domain-containing protein [Candidatus Omnitrophota bacterium]